MMESRSALGPSNTSVTLCPVPFIAELSIPHQGGYVAGRWCEPFPISGEEVSCCFPCPITDWRYSDEFTTAMVPWIGLFVLIMMLISLTTYVVLPVSATQRHYLTTAPLMGFVFMTLAFIIPLGPAVSNCYDEITPNHWLSETPCAFSGSLLLYGVWVVVLGCFFRALSLYLQLCWEHEPGKIFRNVSLTCIFLGGLALLVVALTVSGVSYQVGDVCYISYPRSQGSFWGPLISVAGLSFLLQLLVVFYCIRGVLTMTGNPAVFSIFKRPPTPGGSRGGPARHTSRRIWHILQLQWRPVAIVLLILFHVIFVAQVVLRYRDAHHTSAELAPWISCLIETRGDRNECAGHVNLAPTQGESVGALALLASCGFWGFLCTVRRSMILAWFDWLRDKRDRWLGCARMRTPDIERVPSTTTSSLDRMSSPSATLDDIDRVYGKREYHVPKYSFSAPGRTSTVVTTITGGMPLSPLSPLPVSVSSPMSPVSPTAPLPRSPTSPTSPNSHRSLRSPTLPGSTRSSS